MDSVAALQEFLEYVVAQLIEHHDQASVLHDYEEGKQRHLFRIVLAKSDVGKVIGRHGNTIVSIRSLMSAATTRSGLKASVEVGTREEMGVGEVPTEES